MRRRFFVLICLLPAISCNVAIVHIDADGFNNGDNISNGFAGIVIDTTR